ncbi:hypothetical protein BT63DRAFT_459434 [Microthyrium microscopicum]|uniref:Uncharacterized protein n=1 Tax=Microthyrium microscopicum TaxID=703497 RepID=A0A6A6U0P3_9PEZI|nr:hypothetical protein BT63DRAFT_459434 [Microthyrium microscopicum]
MAALSSHRDSSAFPSPQQFTFWPLTGTLFFFLLCFLFGPIRDFTVPQTTNSLHPLNPVAMEAASTTPRFFCKEQEAMHQAFTTGGCQGLIDYLFLLDQEIWPPATETPLLIALKSPSSLQTTVAMMNEILLSIPSSVIESLILCAPNFKENLWLLPKPIQPRLTGPPDLGRKPSGAQSKPLPTWSNWPCIYIVSHADHTSKAPSRDVYERAHQRLIDYSRNQDEIDPASQGEARKMRSKIDNAITTGSSKGEHKYAATDADQKTWRAWCNGFEKRLNSMPVTDVTRSQPLPWILSHVGYTHDAPKRSVDHGRQINSNRLMNGTEAAVLVEEGQWRQSSMQFQVLCHMPSQYHATIAEHIISLISFSYCQFGGFNYAIGGKHIYSASRVPGWFYNLVAKRIKSSEVYHENEELEIKLADAKRQAAQAKEAGEKRLADAKVVEEQEAELRRLTEQEEALETILANLEQNHDPDVAVLAVMDKLIGCLEDFIREEEELEL